MFIRSSIENVLLGIHTVCVLASKFGEEATKNPSAPQQYCANVLHKFNLKLGGINQSMNERDDQSPGQLSVLRKGSTMVVGIDVTHPSPQSEQGANKPPSVAGVVASVDQAFAQFPASIRIQEPGSEKVLDLKEMFLERLRHWEGRNKSLPQQVIVYRDGISESQYQEHLNTEVRDIRGAYFEAFERRYKRKPKLVFIVVGKRHHTRFYPVDEKGAMMAWDKRANRVAMKDGNPKNGLVVDRSITMERGWDFFLQAHKCLTGTAKPAHYIVLLDDIKMTQDELEELVESSCSRDTQGDYAD